MRCNYREIVLVVNRSKGAKLSSRITNHVLRATFCVSLFARFIVPPIVLCILPLGGCSSPNANFRLSPIDKDKLIPILDALRVNYDLISTLQMAMKVTIEEDGQKEEIREYLWYKKSVTDGDLLHIQAMGPYNEPRVIAIAAREKFFLRYHNENEVVIEPLADGVLKEIFGMDLRVSDIRNTIFANPFLNGSTENLSLAHSGTKYVVRRPGAKAEQIEVITIIMRDLDPTVRVWNIENLSGEVIQKTKFSDYREVGGIMRPHKVEVERPIEKTRVVLHVIKPEINSEISDTKFEFDRFLDEHTKVRALSE